MVTCCVKIFLWGQFRVNCFIGTCCMKILLLGQFHGDNFMGTVSWNKSCQKLFIYFEAQVGIFLDYLFHCAMKQRFQESMGLASVVQVGCHDELSVLLR